MPDVILKQTSIKFVKPDIPPTLNKMLRQHYSVRKKLKEKYMWLIKEQGFRMHECDKLVSCHIEYHTCIWRDWDGLAGSAKIVLDALVKLKCIKDDSPEYIFPFTMSQPKAKKIKDQYWMITLTTTEKAD